MRVLRGFGIALGVLLLLGAGGWQLWHEDGGILKSLPTRQEKEVAGTKEIAVYCQYGAAQQLSCVVVTCTFTSAKLKAGTPMPRSGQEANSANAWPTAGP